MRDSFLRRALFASLLITFGPIADSPAAGQSHFVGPRAEPCVNLRSGPDFRAQILDCLRPETPVTVIGEIDRWRQLRLDDGREGWVSAYYLVAVPGAPPPPAEATAADAEPQIAPDALNRRLAESEADRARLSREVTRLEAEILELRATVQQSRSEKARVEAKVAVMGAKAPAPAAPPPLVAPAAPFAQRQADPAGGAPATEPVAASASPTEPPPAEGGAEKADNQPTQEPETTLVAARPATAPAQPAQRNTDDAATEAEPTEETPGAEPETTLAAAEALPSPAEEAQALVEAWARAWADQRVDDYLGFYSQRFEPDGSDRATWAARRRERVSRPGFIEVTIEGPEVVGWGENRLTLRFEQGYRSESYEDRVVKELELVREEEGWKILHETTVAVAAP